MDTCYGGWMIHPECRIRRCRTWGLRWCYYISVLETFLTRRAARSLFTAPNLWCATPQPQQPYKDPALTSPVTTFHPVPKPWFAHPKGLINVDTSVVRKGSPLSPTTPTPGILRVSKLMPFEGPFTPLTRLIANVLSGHRAWNGQSIVTAACLMAVGFLLCDKTAHSTRKCRLIARAKHA